MEKNHEVLSPKFNLYHLFTLVVMMMMSIGLSHSSHVDQASRLRAVRRAKRQARSFPDDNQEWTMLSLEGGEALSFNGGKMEDDLIAGGLPGQPSGVRFKQYGGYVNVDGSNGRSLFYYFAEAVKDPSSKPLLLWLNGGPGCSSLGMGAMVEIGPFGVNPDGKSLYSRRYSWNKVANVLFVESPAGVGFSYSNTSSDYSTSGDKRTALDTYNFLINWFRRYPHYKASDFYIAGESYAGKKMAGYENLQDIEILPYIYPGLAFIFSSGYEIQGFYIPELADIIVNRSREASSTSKIQLKGILVGNGIMNDPTDLKGCFDYLWNHALISDQTYQGLLDHCLKSKISKMCEDYEGRVETEVGNIDFYNIYSSVCPHNSSNSSARRKARGFGGYDPCERDYVHMYLNLPQVQQAFHANITKLPYTWELCSDVINSWKDSPSTMFPIYRRLIATGLRILLYSGDTDAVVPVSGTRYAIDALNLTVTKAWHPWSDDSHDVSGYTVVYEGLTFTTVRGAGHQVPQCQPCRAFALFKNFVMGN